MDQGNVIESEADGLRYISNDSSTKSGISKVMDEDRGSDADTSEIGGSDSETNEDNRIKPDIEKEKDIDC